MLLTPLLEEMFVFGPMFCRSPTASPSYCILLLLEKTSLPASSFELQRYTLNLKVGTFSLTLTPLPQFQNHDENKKELEEHLKSGHFFIFCQVLVQQQQYAGQSSVSHFLCFIFWPPMNGIVATFDAPRLHHTEDESSNVTSTVLQYSHGMTWAEWTHAITRCFHC